MDGRSTGGLSADRPTERWGGEGFRGIKRGVVWFVCCPSPKKKERTSCHSYVGSSAHFPFLLTMYINVPEIRCKLKKDTWASSDSHCWYAYPTPNVPDSTSLSQDLTKSHILWPVSQKGAPEHSDTHLQCFAQTDRQSDFLPCSNCIVSGEKALTRVHGKSAVHKTPHQCLAHPPCPPMTLAFSFLPHWYELVLFFFFLHPTNTSYSYMDTDARIFFFFSSNHWHLSFFLPFITAIRYS